jgi:hypothetical protein
VLGSADVGYDDARVCFNALVDRRPAVIVKCTGPPDVATAFDFARLRGIPVTGPVAGAIPGTIPHQQPEGGSR